MERRGKKGKGKDNRKEKGRGGKETEVGEESRGREEEGR